MKTSFQDSTPNSFGLFANWLYLDPGNLMGRDLVEILWERLHCFLENSGAIVPVLGIWETYLTFNPSPDERVFRYKFLLCKTLGLGASTV